MTDLGEEDGGETVFVNGKPIGDNPKTYQEALKELRESEQAALFKRDSWEEKMVARCRSSLAVRPNSARAVLFYSQLPNGAPDPASLHGGCPVVSSTAKWAANCKYSKKNSSGILDCSNVLTDLFVVLLRFHIVWVWNTPVSLWSWLCCPVLFVLITVKKSIDAVIWYRLQQHHG